MKTLSAGSALLAFVLGSVVGQEAVASAAAKIPDFTFIHASDTHAPLEGSAATLLDFKVDGDWVLSDSDAPLPRPSFIVVTGDLTEFGGARAGSAAFDRCKEWIAATGLSPQWVMGNHDATWDCLRPRLRAEGQPPDRVFLAHGCAFVVLDSSTPQDPRPSFGAEDLAFLKKELPKIPPETPIFLFSHHPPDGTEFASARERGLVLDLLDGRTVAAWLVGHYHTAFHARTDGIDIVGGGSTLPKTPEHRGANVVIIKDEQLKIVFRGKGEKSPTRVLLEKPLRTVYHGALAIETPEASAVVRSESLAIRATATHIVGMTGMTAIVEGTELAVPLTTAPGAEGVTILRGELPAKALAVGDHVLRIQVSGREGERWARTQRFTIERSSRFKIRWRTEFDDSIRFLRRFGGLLLIGGDGGRLRAVDLATGSKRFTHAANGELVAAPLILDDRAVLATGGGSAFAIDPKGRILWSLDLGDPVFSAPALCGGAAIFGTNGGRLIAVDPARGLKLAEITAAGYSIEAPLAVRGDLIAFGAWDEHIHAFQFDGAAFKRAFQCRGAGSRAAKAASRYFSPADAAVVFSGDRLFAADRAYALTVIDPANGEFKGTVPDVVAIAAGPSPGTVIARGKSNEVLLIDGDRPKWRLSVPTGTVPGAPVALGDGRYLVLGDRGELSIVDPKEDRILERYDLCMGSFHLAAPEYWNGTAFVGGLDGTLTALDIPAR